MKSPENQAIELLASLPTELTISEVEQIVQRLPHLPSPHGTSWWKRIYGFYLGLLIVIGLGGSSWFTWQNHQQDLSGAEQVQQPIDQDPLALALTDDSTEIGASSEEGKDLFITPLVRQSTSFLSQSAFLPPDSISTAQVTPFPVKGVNRSSRRRKLSNVPLQPFQNLILQGTWKASEKDLGICFDLKLSEKGKEWKSNWNISECAEKTEELSGFTTQVGSFNLNREVGKLVFDRKSSMNGSFQFIPNEGYIQYLHEQVLDLREIPLQELSFSGSHRQTWEGNPIYSENPLALLWLKFFLADINGEYLAYLQGRGFEGKSLEEIWMLADNEVPLSYVQRVLPALQDICPKVDLAGLSQVYLFEVPEDIIHAFKEGGYTHLSAEELIRIQQHEISAEYIQSLNALGFSNVSLSTLTSLWLQKLPSDFISEAQEKGYLDKSLKEYLSLYVRYGSAEIPPFSGETPPSELVSQSFTISPFQKLVVRGKVRVLLQIDTINQVTIFQLPFLGEHIKTQQKGNSLHISPRIGFQSIYPYDVQVSTTEVETLVTRNGGQIYVSGDLGSVRFRGTVYSDELLDLPDTPQN